MEFSIFKSEIFRNEKTFRTPFKVTSMCFSSQNDLIALGSKTGEVMMKRTSWKMIWKTNISMVPAVGTECKTESSVTALHFSPNGKFLAAATSKGLLHLLDVESGKIRYSVKAATESIVKLYWDKIRETQSCPNRFEGMAPFMRTSDTMDGAVRMARSKPDISREEIGFVYQRLDEDGSSFKHDEAQKDALDKTFISSETFQDTLCHTVLLAAQDDNKINVLLAGVLPYTVIDVDEVLTKYNQGIVLFYDMHYSHAFGGVSFLATTFGPYLNSHNQEMKPPSPDASRPGQGCHTLLFNMKLEIDPALWDAAFRYIRLLFGYSMFSIILDTTKRNWENQISVLHSRFDTKTKALKIGEVLLEMLLSGATDPAGEAFLERGLGADGLQGIRDFAEKHMSEVSRLVRGQLTSSVRNLLFQRVEFADALERADYYKRMANSDSFLYDEEPTELDETNPWLNELEKQLDILSTKVSVLGTQCVTMIQELSHLAKWISLTKPFSKNMKVNALMKLKKMNIESILKYIVSNFFPDSESSKKITERLFDLKKQIAKWKEEDAENKFNEIEYLEKLEEVARGEKKKLEDKFQIKINPLNDLFGDFDKSEEKENEENKLEDSSAMETVVAEEEEVGLSYNLDRVGSFFTKEISEKALEVYPELSETFDNVLGNQAAFHNSDEVKKMGLVTILDKLADLLSNPQRMHKDQNGKEMKLEVHFVHEIASDAAHRGYIDAKLCNTAPADFIQEPLETDGTIDYNSAISVSVVEKNLLQTTVLFPKVNLDDDHAVKSHEYQPSKTVYEFKTVTAQDRRQDSAEDEMKDAFAEGEEPMEVDENNELRIDVEVEQLLPQYDNLVEYDRVFHLHHQHLVVLGKFTSNQEGTGRATRMMRYTAEEKEFSVNLSVTGKAEGVIENMVVHPTTQLCAFLHDEGSKITVGDLKIEKQSATPQKQTSRKTFRDYQRRRERYREDMGVGNLNDIQYDVLVQEAMDSGRDPTGSGGELEEEEF